MKFITTCLILSLGLLVAQEPAYRYFEFGYATSNPDNDRLDPVGAYALGAFHAQKSFFEVEATILEDSNHYLDIKTRTLDLFGGYKAKISRQFHLNFGGGLFINNSEHRYDEGTEVGYRAGIMARGKGGFVSYEIGAYYVDYFDNAFYIENFLSEIKVTFYISKRFGIALGGQFNDKSKGATVGFRIGQK